MMWGHGHRCRRNGLMPRQISAILIRKFEL